MKVARMSLGSLGAFTLSACAACLVHASTWMVSFDPAAPVNTNGWDLSQSSAQEKTSQSPAGRKLAPKNKGDTSVIESPVHSARIRAVSLAFKCVGVKGGNSSKVEVFGRAATGTDYRILFSEPTLPGSPTNLCSSSYVTPLADFDCRQVKIAYTKDSGNLVVSSVAFEDDAIRAEPPTNLRTAVVDDGARRVRVSWDLAEGLSESEWRTFTTATVGGIDESETLWRESFDGVPAVTATKLLNAETFAALGFDSWEAETVRQLKGTPGALLIGWSKGVVGSLTTPPLDRDIEKDSTLVLRAAKQETKSGVLPVSVISGVETSRIAHVAITATPTDYVLPLPALAQGDRILIQSCTNQNQKTLVYDLAICAAGAYVAESVVTNACSDVTSAFGNSAEVTVPTDGTNLWLEARTVYGGERSAWTEPFLVTLSNSGASESGGEVEDDDSSGLAAPSHIRAGRLPDGKIRVGWETPVGATNVRLRVWTLATSGGLAAVAKNDVLWRETFAAAPATNTSTSKTKIDNADKWELYADLGTNGWDWANCKTVYLATDAGAVRVGNTSSSGELVTRPLGLVGEDLTLVITARRAASAAGTDLHAAVITAEGVTNEMETAMLTDAFTETALPVNAPLAATDVLVLSSPIAKKSDFRMNVSDIAIVRNYLSVSCVTNVLCVTNLGLSAACDLAAADGSEFFVSLAAEGADGLSSDWTEPQTIDPAALADWRERFVTMKGEDVSIGFISEDLPSPDGKSWDVSESPFRFFLDGNERFELLNRDATKQLQVGVYVCTNVFGSNWAVLVPGSPNTVAEVKDAECRLTIRTDAFAARRLELSGTFAQLNATNTNEKSLALEYRAIRPDGTASDWTTMGEYKSTFTATDIAPDLAGTWREVSCATDLRLPRGSTVEARVYCRKAYESGREPPLGFRDFRVRVLGVGPSLLFVIR